MTKYRVISPGVLPGAESEWPCLLSFEGAMRRAQEIAVQEGGPVTVFNSRGEPVVSLASHPSPWSWMVRDPEA